MPEPADDDSLYGSSTHVMNYLFGTFFHHVTNFPSVLKIIPPRSKQSKIVTDERVFALGNLIINCTMMNNEFRLVQKVVNGRDDLGFLAHLQSVMESPIEYFNRLEINYPSLIELRKCCDDISNRTENSFEAQCFNKNEFLLERRLSWLDSIGMQENRVLEWSNTLSDDFGNDYQHNGLKMLYSPSCAIVFSEKPNILECGTEVRGLIFKLLKQESIDISKLIVLISNGLVYHFSIDVGLSRDVDITVYNVLSIHNNISDLTRLFQMIRYFLSANRSCHKFHDYVCNCFDTYMKMYKIDTCPRYREIMANAERRKNERNKNEINKQHKTIRKNTRKKISTLVLQDITNTFQNMKL